MRERARRRGRNCLRADGHDAVVGFDHIAVARNDQRLVLVQYGEQASSCRRYLSLRHSRASSTAARSKLPRNSCNFASNFSESVKRVARAAGKARQYRVVVHAADFCGNGASSRCCPRSLGRRPRARPRHCAARPARWWIECARHRPMNASMEIYSNRFRSRATGSPMDSRYFATVLRAMVKPRCCRMLVSS